MTLSCNKCGGAVEIQSASYTEVSASELYRCNSCGATGSQTLYSDPEVADERTGCIA